MTPENADRAYMMFQNGFDSVEIAKKLRVHEGIAVELIQEGRERMRINKGVSHETQAQRTNGSTDIRGPSKKAIGGDPC